MGAKPENAIPNGVTNRMVDKSIELLNERKKHKVSFSLTTAKTLQVYKCMSFPVHNTRITINCLDTATNIDYLIVSGGDNGCISLFDRSHGYVLSTILHGEISIATVKFAWGIGTLLSASQEGTVKLWKRGASDFVSQSVTYRHSTEIVYANIHPTRNYIVTVCKNNRWRLWDVETSNIVTTVTEATLNGNYTSAELHPDGLILGTGTDESIVRLFDISVGKEVARFPQMGSEGHKGHLTHVTFSENGYLMASAAGDGVRIWDLRKLKCVKYIKTPRLAYRIYFDHSGSYLAIGSATLCVCAVKQNYRVVCEFDISGTEQVRSLCFGSETSFLAVGTTDHNLRIFSPIKS